MRDGAAAEYVAVPTDALAAKPVSVDHVHAAVLTRISVDEATNEGVTRGYHLLAMPSNRLRTSVDWALDAVLPRQRVQLGLVRAPAVPLDTSSR